VTLDYVAAAQNCYGRGFSDPLTPKVAFMNERGNDNKDTCSTSMAVLFSKLQDDVTMREAD